MNLLSQIPVNRAVLLFASALSVLLAACTFTLIFLDPNNHWFWLGMTLSFSVLGSAAFFLAPRVEARLLVDRGRAMISIGHFDQALTLLNRAVNFAPRLVPAYLVRCAAYAGLAQTDLALDDAEHAVKLAPTLPEAWLVRARLYSYRGLYENAIRDLRTAIRIKPDWTVGYMELAQLHIRLEDYQHSLATLRDLYTHSASDEVQYDSLLLSGWVYEEKLNDLDGAIAAYTRAIPLLPDRKIGYLRRAHAYRTRGDQYQAAEDLLRAAQRQPMPEDLGQYHWMRAACFWGRYSITHEPRDYQLWLNAIEQSIREDTPQYSQQSRQWLANEMAHESRVPVDSLKYALKTPPTPRIFPN